jgi:hypothetical protein
MELIERRPSMAHIDLGFDEHQFPGMSGLMRCRPETGKAIGELADFLLRAPNSMPRGDRERLLHLQEVAGHPAPRTCGIDPTGLQQVRGWKSGR